MAGLHLHGGWSCGDGTGGDRSHGGEGQTSTRLGAFLEMLNTETDENTDRQEELHDE
jgi:hypothetical protein